MRGWKKVHDEIVIDMLDEHGDSRDVLSGPTDYIEREAERAIASGEYAAGVMVHELIYEKGLAESRPDKFLKVYGNREALLAGEWIKPDGSFNHPEP